jgi:PST family polysaccharide transporter
LTRPSFPAGHRRILKVTAGLGASAVLVAGLGVVRTKVLAVELGPEGIALVALAQGACTFLALAGGLGVSSSGVLELSERRHANDLDGVSHAWRAILLLTLAASAALGFGLLVAAGPVAGWLGGGMQAGDVRLLAGAVVGNVLATAGVTVLNGHERLRALALLGPLTAAAGTLVAVPLLLAGVNAVAAVLLVPYAIQAAVTWIYVRRQVGRPTSPPQWRAIRSVSRRLVGLGGAVVVQGLVGAGALLLLRVLLADRLGPTGLGHFQAAFAVAETYVGFLLVAMAADYLPRLGALRGDRGMLGTAANVQAQIAVVIATGLSLVLLLAAPLVLRLLFSAEFLDATGTLRILLLAEVVRVAAWAFGFVLVSSRRGLALVMSEVLHYGLFVVLALWLVGPHGLEGVAVAYGVAYAVSLVLVLLLVRREGVTPSPRTWAVVLGCGGLSGLCFAAVT